jgi:membrane protease YdiL (CAAX protease family)
VGVVLGVLIASLTFLFVYLKTRPHGRYSAALFGYAPWVFLFAASNSLSEEVIYRLGIVAPLLEHLPVPVVLLLSAAVFGLLHYRGTPNGLFGAALAAVLGWILAKSMVETAGIFWAWSVHFLQDLVIFPALIILSAPGHADARRWWQRMRPG